MILLEFQDGRGINKAGTRIFINPDQVTSLEEDQADTTLVRTISYNHLVKGNIQDVAITLMLKEMADLAGVPFTDLVDKLQEQA